MPDTQVVVDGGIEEGLLTSQGGIVSDRGEEDVRMHYGVGCAAYQVGDVLPEEVLARVALEIDEPHRVRHVSNHHLLILEEDGVSCQATM